MLDEKTRWILVNNLKFTDHHLIRLEENTDLLSKTLGLIELIKKSENKTKIRFFINEEFKKIKFSLNKQPSNHRKHMAQARAEYYSFRKYL